jgi:4-hydroxyproline epimerase
MSIHRIRAIDSHTGGEPTRLIIEGGPDLDTGSLLERRERFRAEFDRFRSAVVNEPRGSDVVVGGLLTEPVDPTCAAGVIFFNNVAYLGMCGHGSIGVVATLAYLGRLQPGSHRLETPVGVVTAELAEDGSVSIVNVPSYRYLKGASVTLDSGETVTGDVAWGGNWFFLVEAHGREIALSDVDALTDYTWRIRQALERNGITGKDGAEIDHVELFAPSQTPGVHSRNFVLCPGKAYDRSPCGTGTSAKLACLYADGKLAPGEIWRQESVVGTLFEGTVESVEGSIIPTIRGRAYVNGELTLILDDADPFCWGIR